MKDVTSNNNVRELFDEFYEEFINELEPCQSVENIKKEWGLYKKGDLDLRDRVIEMLKSHQARLEHESGDLKSYSSYDDMLDDIEKGE